MTPIFIDMGLGVDLQTNTKKTYVFKGDWTTCSKYDNRYRFNIQHNWGDL